MMVMAAFEFIVVSLSLKGQIVNKVQFKWRTHDYFVANDNTYHYHSQSTNGVRSHPQRKRRSNLQLWK
ncbi:hypothetical protein KVR801_70039 [Klebsiella variicola]|nr:hypothetical protein KVR801_70039 [Klebsiella variicola]